MSDDVLLTVHLAATASMVGLIWFVQLVHYPLFAVVGAEGFAAYERDHQRRTAWVVGPLMGVEVVSALALVAAGVPGVGRTLPVIAVVVLGVVHVSTIGLQVPAHGRLSSGFDAAVARRLVRSNWIRTVGWSLRGVLAAVMVVRAR